MGFSDIVGHKRAVAILRRVLAERRVAHSFIFSGLEGIGKRLTALAFAKALNCTGTEGDFCGACRSCKGIDSGNNVNVQIVEPREPESKGGEVNHLAGTIRIDDIRTVQTRLSYSIDSGSKVCIVDGAEKMTNEAANAFLKTLEEPPDRTVVILITSRFMNLLPTIRSRCQRINFAPIPKDVAMGMVSGKAGISQEKAGVLLSLSGGSIGRAMELYEGGAMEMRDNLIKQLISCIKDGGGEILKAAEALSQGDGVDDALIFLKSWYRDMAVLKEGGGDIVNSDMADRLSEQAGRMKLDRIVDGFHTIDRALKDITPPRYANRQLTMEVLLMDLLG